MPGREFLELARELLAFGTLPRHCRHRLYPLRNRASQHNLLCGVPRARHRAPVCAILLTRARIVPQSADPAVAHSPHFLQE